MCSSRQDFNRYGAPYGPCVAAELLVEIGQQLANSRTNLRAKYSGRLFRRRRRSFICMPCEEDDVTGTENDVYDKV